MIECVCSKHVAVLEVSTASLPVSREGGNKEKGTYGIANRTVLGMLVLTSTETHARLESSPTSTVVLSYTSNKNVTGSILLSHSRADWKRTSIAVRFGIVGGEGGSLLVCFVGSDSTRRRLVEESLWTLTCCCSPRRVVSKE